MIYDLSCKCQAFFITFLKKSTLCRKNIAFFCIVRYYKGIKCEEVKYVRAYFIFNGESLGYICRFLSKWYSVKINLAPSLSDKYIYSFTLRHETLEEIVRIMARLNPLEYNFDEHNVLTIKEISSTNP